MQILWKSFQSLTEFFLLFNRAAIGRGGSRFTRCFFFFRRVRWQTIIFRTVMADYAIVIKACSKIVCHALSRIKTQTLWLYFIYCLFMPIFLCQAGFTG